MHFDFYGLITAVAPDVETHIVPFLAQLAHAFVRNAAFNFDIAAVLHFFAGRFVVAFVVPARRVAGFLHIQTKVNLVSEYLHVSLRLHIATHHAECFPWFAIFHHEPWNDGVKRAFSRRVNIRVLRVHGKKFAPILKHEAKTRHDDPTAHAAIITLDERDHIAFIVRRAEINRVALIQQARL